MLVALPLVQEYALKITRFPIVVDVTDLGHSHILLLGGKAGFEAPDATSDCNPNSRLNVLRPHCCRLMIIHVPTISVDRLPLGLTKMRNVLNRVSYHAVC